MINRLTLIGTLSAPPELVTSRSTTPCYRLQLAVLGRCKDRQSGLVGNHSGSFTIEVVGGQTKESAKNLKVGDRVVVSGHPHWPPRNRRAARQRYSSVLIANELSLLASGDEMQKTTDRANLACGRTLA
jgi:single-stranded DNA-binding protein